MFGDLRFNVDESTSKTKYNSLKISNCTIFNHKMNFKIS